jgi:hypothetical protein
MKQLSTLIILFFLSTHLLFAQVTSLPDENFEQALIDLAIDTDGVINGQVLTADIENIIELNFSELNATYFIDEFTGIEDFTQLEILNLDDYLYFSILEEQSDFLNNNLKLREIYITNPCGDCGSNGIESLDISNLKDLEYLDVSHLIINSILLNNPEYNYTNLTLNLYHEGFPKPRGFSNSKLSDFFNICIRVNDPVAANSGSFPYNTWTILETGQRTYNFSSTCNLNIDDFESLNSISVYPNPVSNTLNFNNPNRIKLDQAKVYNMEGRLVKSFLDVKENINLEDLVSGVYFIIIKNKQQEALSLKVIKQ